MRELYNFDMVAKINIDLNLRPQNLSKDVYLNYVKYMKQIINFLT